MRYTDVGLRTAYKNIKMYLFFLKDRNNIACPAQMAVARTLNGVKHFHRNLVFSGCLMGNGRWIFNLGFGFWILDGLAFEILPSYVEKVLPFRGVQADL